MFAIGLETVSTTRERVCGVRARFCRPPIRTRVNGRVRVRDNVGLRVRDNVGLRV